jgi:hypothetical protein
LHLRREREKRKWERKNSEREDECKWREKKIDFASS